MIFTVSVQHKPPIAVCFCLESHVKIRTRSGIEPRNQTGWPEEPWDDSSLPARNRTTTMVMLSPLPLWEASCISLFAASSGSWIGLVIETASWRICTKPITQYGRRTIKDHTDVKQEPKFGPHLLPRPRAHRLQGWETRGCRQLFPPVTNIRKRRVWRKDMHSEQQNSLMIYSVMALLYCI